MGDTRVIRQSAAEARTRSLVVTQDKSNALANYIIEQAVEDGRSSCTTLKSNLSIYTISELREAGYTINNVSNNEVEISW